MHTTRYKVWQWTGQTRDGANIQFNVAIRTKAKRSLDNPFEIPNELLCMRLGLAMGLPIPVGVIICDDNDDPYFASLHPAVAGEKLPPATKHDLSEIASDVRLTCGIIMFDSWILNEDRYQKNISHLNGQTFIFDHGRAFFDKQGRAFLESRRRSLGIGYHCLSNLLTSMWQFDLWHRRMLAVPEHFIADSVSLACEFGLPENDRKFCTDYLLERRANLKEIFRNNRNRFPSLDDGLFDPLNDIIFDYNI